MVVFDEYHYGAWRENAKELLQQTTVKKSFLLGEGLKLTDHDILPIKSNPISIYQELRLKQFHLVNF